MNPRRLPTIAASALATACFALAPASAAADCPDADQLPAVGTSSPAAFSRALLCLLNQQRAKHGLGRLSSKYKLVEVATAHSQEMRSDGYFSHESPSGETFIDRIRQTGYTNGAHFWALSENIGWGSDGEGTPRAIDAAWMNSAPHRANILSRRFRQVGLGVAWGSPFGPDQIAAVVTVDFGVVKH